MTDKRFSPFRKRASSRQPKSAKPLLHGVGDFHGSNWSIDEDERLREGVLQFGGKKWKAIAQRIPNRSALQCNRRWNQLQSVGAVIKKPWSEREDSEMQRLVVKFGASKWAVIASYLPGRNGKQCRERWHNQLNPAIKKGPWTEDEDNIIFEMQSKYGNCWAKITERLPGRTDNAVKNHWHSSMKGKKKQRDAMLLASVAQVGSESPIAHSSTKFGSKSKHKSRSAGFKRKRSTSRKGAKKAKKTSNVPVTAESPTSVSAVDEEIAATGTWERLGWCYAAASLLADEELSSSSEEAKPVVPTVLFPTAIPAGDEVCDSILAESEDEEGKLFIRKAGSESETDVELTAAMGVPSVGPSVFEDAMRTWKSEVASPESSVGCSPPCFSLSPGSDADDLDDEDDDLPAFYNLGMNTSSTVMASLGCGMARAKMEYPDAAPSSNLTPEEASRVDAMQLADSFLRPGISSLSALMLVRDSEDEKEQLRAVGSDCDSFGSKLDAAAMATVDAPVTA